MIVWRDRLSFALRRAIEEVEQAISARRTLELRLAGDYSSRDSILRAAERIGGAVCPSEAARQAHTLSPRDA